MARLSWPEMGADEWVRQSWPARCRTESDGSDQTYAEGTLTLTNRRLFFTGASELDESLIFDFDDLLLAVRWQRHSVFSYSLIVETASCQRFEFRTKKLACKQIATRFQMRTVASSRARVVRLGSTAGEAEIPAAIWASGSRGF